MSIVLNFFENNLWCDSLKPNVQGFIQTHNCYWKYSALSLSPNFRFSRGRKLRQSRRLKILDFEYIKFCEQILHILEKLYRDHFE